MKDKKAETKMKKKMKKEKIVETTKCLDKDCPTHGNLKTRGRTFQGIVVKKFDKRVAIEFERTIYIRKYERYAKSKTKIHARLPKCIDDKIQIGDLIKVQECRPLSKIIHFVVVEKIKSGEEKTENSNDKIPINKNKEKEKDR